MFGKNFGKFKSLKQGRRMAHNAIALMFLFVPMVLFGQALFSYAATGVSVVNESVANRRLAESQVRSQQAVLFEEGIISLTFDDGWKSIATDAAPIMAKYQIASTQYVVVNSIGMPSYMSLGQLKAMKAAGHEIASHGMNHIPLAERSNETVKYEFTESKKRLIEMELIDKTGVSNFAYPYGSYSTSTNSIGAPTYLSLRGATDELNDGVDEIDINTRSSFAPHSRFVGMTIDKTTRISHIRDAIKYAKDNKGWLVLNFHQIDRENTKFSISPDTFERILHIIMDENIKTVTVANAMATYKASQ